MNKEIIPLFKVIMSPTAQDKVNKTLSSGYLGQGQVNAEFENLIRGYFHHDYVATLNSATSGLALAISLLKKPFYQNTPNFLIQTNSWPGLKEDDEVLICPLTCYATTCAVIDYHNLNIKWVDVDPKTCNMDLDDLERKISSKTKLIIPVFWGGMPIDLDRLKKIQLKAKELYGFKPAIIEDAAHAIGAEYKGKKIGTTGNITVFSLQAIKHVTAGDGGILMLPHKNLWDRTKLSRWYGFSREDITRLELRCLNDTEGGFKYHMNDISSSIGVENFKLIDEILDKHRRNANILHEGLKSLNLDGITLLDNPDDRKSSWWIYTLLVERRGDFVKAMKDRGIHTNHVHERNDNYTSTMKFRSLLPNLDNIAPKICCLPCGSWVSKENCEYIIEQIKKGW